MLNTKRKWLSTVDQKSSGVYLHCSDPTSIDVTSLNLSKKRQEQIYFPTHLRINIRVHLK